jgi:tetratricopeptide (TPR) repeat protein
MEKGSGMDQERPVLAADGEEPGPPRPLLKIAGVLGVAALAGAAAFAIWRHQTQLSEDQYLSRARSYMEGGQVPAAIIDLKNALQANPRNGKTHFDLALAYLRLGLGQEAEEQLTRARELGADPRTVGLPLGEALLLQQKHDKVLQEVTPSAYTLPAERQQALRIHADALLGLGKADEACPIFRQSREADPKHVPAYWGLMKCAVVKKDFQTARAHLDTALKLEPHNLRSLMLKASLAQDMNDPAGAEAAYGEALALDPDSIPAWIARAAVRLEAGKIDQAVEDVEAEIGRASCRERVS